MLATLINIMALSFLPLKSAEFPEQKWNQVVLSSPEAWIWHFYELHEFRKAYALAKGLKIEDHSFFVYQDKRLVGLVPALLVSNVEESGEIRHLGYHDTPLPWPCFIESVADTTEVRKAAFDALEKLAQDHQAATIWLMLSHFNESLDFRERCTSEVVSRNYFDLGYETHLVHIVPDLLSRVRRRYVQYIDKCGPNFDVQIVCGEGVTDELVEQYSVLHAKDAGFVPRPLETYLAQACSARIGHGFWVVLRRKTDGKLAGILQILTFKNAAYPDSVAVDPECAKEGVSYLLHWNGTREAMLRGICTYDLGIVGEAPSLSWLPSKRYKSISFFKDGWSRGNRRRISVYRKFVDPGYVKPFFERLAGNAVRYLEEDRASAQIVAPKDGDVNKS